MATKVPLSAAWEHYRNTTDHAHGEKHVREVLRIIRPLAKKHGVDKQKAEMAAILHDIGRETERRIPGIDHAVAGADIARHFTDDKEVLDAIRRHRKGSGEMPKTTLDKILWDADLVAGANHAEERAYQWNRDDGLSPAAARRASQKYLKETEIKSYAPRNAYTQEAKEMLSEELPKLKEKLASLLEENERLKKELNVREVRLPALPSITPIALRIPDHLGRGATVLTAPNRYALFADKTNPDSEAVALHKALMNEKYKQKVRERVFGTADPIVDGGIKGSVADIYRSIVSEKHDAYGANTSPHALADHLEVVNGLSDAAKRESYRSSVLRIVANKAIGVNMNPKVPGYDSLRAKANADNPVSDALLPLTDYHLLRDPGTYLSAGVGAATGILAGKAGVKWMKGAKPLKRLLGYVAKKPSSAAYGAAFATALGLAAKKLNERKVEENGN